jgi:poly(A) polymerase
MRDSAVEVVARLQRAGHVAYFAGGSVRDQLLGREAKDYDIATSALPDQVQKLFPRVTDLTGKSFGVVRVLVGEGTYEVATFRHDGTYVDGRRPVAVRFTTAEEDAQRRDFTINGLFYDPIADRIIDYVGGQADLQARVIRAIGDPAARFAEDHLRLLRAVRFASRLNFRIEGNTWAALVAAAPRIRDISVERIRDELNLIFTTSKPELGLDLLDRSGLLTHVLPDIAALHGVEQPPQYHPEGDVFEHVRLMLTKIPEPNLPLALSILLHDVGKKATATIDESGRIRHSGHETVGADMAERIMTGLRYDNKTIATVREAVQHHMQFKDVPHMRPSTLKRMMARPHFPLELELHRIDCASSHGDLKHYEFLKHQVETMAPEEIEPPRLINGRDLLAMGIPPGKSLGVILEKIYEAQLEGTVQTRAQAIEVARQMASAPSGQTTMLPNLAKVRPPKEPIDDRLPPHVLVRSRRESLGLSVEEMAAILELDPADYPAIEIQPQAVTTALTLRQFHLLGQALKLTVLEIFPEPRLSGTALTLDNLRERLEAYRQAKQMSLAQFEKKLGFDLQPFGHDPAAAEGWTVSQLRALCETLAIDWRVVRLA